MAEPIQLFDIGVRGVNVVSAPTDMGLEEVRSAQNAEVVSDKGVGALDQRPGMTRVNATPLTGSVLMAHDVPADVLVVKTPTMYAGMHSSATANWRMTTDGVTWTPVPVPAKPFSANANIAGFFKNFPKCVSLGHKMYYPDGLTPIGIHSWDGATDATVALVPPAVSGTTLATPTGTVVFNGTGGTTTYTYQFVAIAGTSHSAASSALSTTIGGPTMGDGSGFTTELLPTPASPPVTGALYYDVYRVAGGATQGKVGTIPIVSGAFTTGNGSGSPAFAFSDDGLVADGTTAPVSASGTTAGDALGVLDIITDGTDIYLAVLDQAPADPVVAGRVLKYSIGANTWTQIGAAFPLSAGNGGPSALVSYDGAFVFGTYIGTTSGNTSYLKSLAIPLPAGGFPETHTTSASQSTSCLAMFNGILYAGYTSLVAGTAAIIAKRVPIATWSTALTALTTGQYNGFTSMCVFNGRLFAGWTPGDAINFGLIYSTLDGTTWTVDELLNIGEMACQMVVFQGSLYAVCGKTGATFNTITQILKRTTGGIWSIVDDPTEDFAGCLGIIYQ